ncbi:hypothetical protein BS17DRAFT_703601, partial [Gyrodon lividus]
LGQEIRQPLHPYANLAQEGVQRCRVNALISIPPKLNPLTTPKSSGLDLGDGYAPLCKRAKYPSLPDPTIARCIAPFLTPGQDMPGIT